MKIKTHTWNKNTPGNQELIDEAFTLSKDKKISRIFKKVSESDGDVNYVLLNLIQIIPNRVNSFEDGKNVIRRLIAKNKRKIGKENFKKELYKNLGVKFYPDNIKFMLDKWHEYLSI